jgi:hypothetical protein
MHMRLYVIVGGSLKFLKYQLTIIFFLFYSHLELMLAHHHYMMMLHYFV